MVGTPLDQESDIIVLTPTLTPTPVGTIVPNAPPISGCNDDRAFLRVPANGMRVFQPIAIIGTAYTNEFTSAKIELAGPSTNGQFVVVDSINSPVRDISEFSQFQPGPYEPGAYLFRLMVFDLSDQLVASCRVTIYIDEPPFTPVPTATPGA